mgnify:CR=1 FL=1
MRYVSNAGIIFTRNEISIGIDCFCKDENNLYPDTPIDIKRELWQQIEDGILGALIFTHEHSDHFYKGDVVEAFRRNQDLQVYSTDAVIKQLMNEGIDPQCLHAVADNEEISFGDMNIKFCYTIHEGEQYADVLNLTLLINTEDEKVVVFGDAKANEALFQRVTEWSMETDKLIVPFPYVGLRSTRKLLQTVLMKKIYALHLPKREMDLQRWAENTKKVCEQATDELPNPIFLETLGKYY